VIDQCRRPVPADAYLVAVRRHVEALGNLPHCSDERQLAHHRWSHWYAVARLARAAGIEVLELELSRQSADGRSA
jgi:hypothetical protein